MGDLILRLKREGQTIVLVEHNMHLVMGISDRLVVLHQDLLHAAVHLAGDRHQVPVHLGIVFLANLELGFLTPPVGVNLFLSSLRFNVPVSVVVRSIIPMLLVLLVGVLLITYIPAMTTTLPRWFGH